jgi:hypothetical protein
MRRVGGDDVADALRYLVATESGTVAQRKLRGSAPPAGLRWGGRVRGYLKLVALQQ